MLPSSFPRLSSLLTVDPDLAAVRVDVRGVAPPVMADPDLLKIVFMNLLANGAHAMEGQGLIRVSLTPAGGMCRSRFGTRVLPAELPAMT